MTPDSFLHGSQRVDSECPHVLGLSVFVCLFLAHSRMMEKLLSTLDSFRGPARAGAASPHIANSGHSVKEQLGCPSCLLTRTRAW